MNKIELSNTYFTNEGLDIHLSNGKIARILTEEEVKIKKKEVKIIDKWYPTNLTEMEKACRGIYSTEHEFQLLIARFRKGDISIYEDEDGINITGCE
jgi:hypothetical protein